MEKNQNPFTLRLVKDGEVTNISCDSIILVMPDAENGSGGGSLGIRPGHRKALIALARGPLCAKKGGAEVFRTVLEGGLAAVTAEGVTVLA